VFTEPLPRSGLHNPVVLLLLGANHIEHSFPYIVASWEVFAEPLRGNVLIKYVTLCLKRKYTRKTQELKYVLTLRACMKLLLGRPLPPQLQACKA
jgi:hypothetical protein